MCGSNGVWLYNLPNRTQRFVENIILMPYSLMNYRFFSAFDD